MSSGGAGNIRLAPVLIVSLLLHLAVIVALTVTAGREGHPKQTVSAMVIAYLAEGKKAEKHESADPQQRNPPPPLKKHMASNVKATPVPLPAQLPAAARSAAPNVTVVPDVPKAISAENAASESTSGMRNSGLTRTPPASSVSGKSSGKKSSAVFEVPPVKGTGTADASDSLSRRAAYQALLKRLIDAHKEYPLAARKSRREGSCQRRFILDRAGSLKHIEVITSCGHAFLDDAATRAISSVGTFPPLPDAFGGTEEAFTITMTFTLAR